MNTYPIVWPQNPPARVESVFVRGALVTMVEFDPQVIDIAAARDLGFKKGGGQFIGTVRALDRADWLVLFRGADISYKHFAQDEVKGLHVLNRDDTIPHMVKDWISNQFYQDAAALKAVLDVNEVSTPLRDAVIEVNRGVVTTDTTPLLRLALLDLLDREDLRPSVRASMEYLMGQINAIDDVAEGLLGSSDSLSQPNRILRSAGETIEINAGDAIKRFRLASNLLENDEKVKVFSHHRNVISNIPLPSIESYSVENIVHPGAVVGGNTIDETHDDVAPLEDVEFDQLVVDKTKDAYLNTGDLPYGFWESVKDNLSTDLLAPDERSNRYPLKAMPAAVRSSAASYLEFGDITEGTFTALNEFATAVTGLDSMLEPYIKQLMGTSLRFQPAVRIVHGSFILDMTRPYYFDGRDSMNALASLNKDSVDKFCLDIKKRLLDNIEFGFRAECQSGKTRWTYLPDETRAKLISLLDTDADAFGDLLWKSIIRHELTQDGSYSDPGRLESISYRNTVLQKRVAAVSEPVSQVYQIPVGSIVRDVESGLCFARKPEFHSSSIYRDPREHLFGSSFADVGAKLFEHMPYQKAASDGRLKDMIGRLEVLDILHRSAVSAFDQMKEPEMKDLISKITVYLQTNQTVLKTRPRLENYDDAERLATTLVNKLRSNATSDSIMPYCYVAFSKRYTYGGTSTADVSQFGVWRFKDIENEMVQDIRKKRGLGNSKVIPINLLALIDPATYEALETRAIESEMSRQASFKKGGTETAQGERQDTGVVYGLARKDIARKWSDELEDYLKGASSTVVASTLARDRIWPKPKPETLQKEGYEPASAWLMLYYHKNLPTKPPRHGLDDARKYVEAVAELRDGLTAAKTYQSAREFLQSWHDKHAQIESVATGSSRYVRRSCEGYLMIPRGRYSYNMPEFASSPFNSEMTERILLADTQDNTSWSWSSGGSGGRARREKLSLNSAPHLQDVKRTGDPVIRPDTLTEVDLIRAFGFSGVEYGNWTNQEERDQCLKFTYDSFDDLAHLYAIPRTSLSMGGRLGLCFGSRGTGGRRAALAHYEPVNIAINLTRLKGAGSLGHEVAHALDGFLAKKAGLGSANYLSNWAHSVRSPSSKESMVALSGLSPEFLKAFRAVYQTIYYAQDQFTIDKDGCPVLTCDEGDEPQKSGMVRFAEKMDEYENMSKPYWSKPIELFARANERWMQHRLESMGITNNYLVNHLRWHDESSIGSVYPSKEQTILIDKAMERLIDAMRTQVEVINHPIGETMEIAVLYSHDRVDRVTDRSLLAQLCVDEVKRCLGDYVSVAFTEELVDESGNTVSGAWDRSTQVIRLSYASAGLAASQHEIYHAAEDLLLTQSEKSLLNNLFRPGSEGRLLLEDSMRKDGKGHLIPYLSNPSEACAYAYQLWSEGKLDLKALPDGDKPLNIFERIVEVLKTIFSVSRSFGFETAEALFQDLHSGALSSRAAGLAGARQGVEGAQHSQDESNDSRPDYKENSPLRYATM